MTLVKRLLDKSTEAFIMAIEIYNKPSIRYRLEGFSFFICNAWELMLKAHLININGENAIYYADKPNRTISLENCLQKVFTNAKSPLRMNMAKIVGLRNTSTHFITEEYEMVYIPLLQACVFNFIEKMNEFHGIDMAAIIPENFITLSVRIEALDETEVRAKYTHQVSERLVNLRKELAPLIEQNNSSFAIRIEHQYYQTKDKSQATEMYHIDKSAKEGVRIIKEMKDPNDTHKYNAKNCIKEIGARLKRKGIVMKYNGAPKDFNMYHFSLFIKYYGIKDNEKYCFTYSIGSQPVYSYSLQTIDFIVAEIEKCPDDIIDGIKQRLQKQRNANPGSEGF